MDGADNVSKHRMNMRNLQQSNDSMMFASQGGRREYRRRNRSRKYSDITIESNIALPNVIKNDDFYEKQQNGTITPNNGFGGLQAVSCISYTPLDLSQQNLLPVTPPPEKTNSPEKINRKGGAPLNQHQHSHNLV